MEVICRSSSHLQTRVFRGEFNHPNTCWRSSRAGHKQSGFGERIYDKFLMKLIKESTMRGWLLDLTLTNMEGLFGDVKVRVKAVAMRRQSQDPEKREQGKKQDHNPGLQEGRL